MYFGLVFGVILGFCATMIIIDLINTEITIKNDRRNRNNGGEMLSHRSRKD